MEGGADCCCLFLCDDEHPGSMRRRIAPDKAHVGKRQLASPAQIMCGLSRLPRAATKTMWLCVGRRRSSTELAMEPTTLTAIVTRVFAMKKFILAGAAVLSLGVGSAFARPTIVFTNGST